MSIDNKHKFRTSVPPPFIKNSINKKKGGFPSLFTRKEGETGDNIYSKITSIGSDYKKKITSKGCVICLLLLFLILIFSTYVDRKTKQTIINYSLFIALIVIIYQIFKQ